MKAALLCNGPSRELFESQSKLDYDYIMGCNIPWTDVHSTVILDIEVADYLTEHRPLLKYPIWFGRDAWREIHRKERTKIGTYFKGIVDKTEGESTGHVGLRKLIEEGYDDIDIFGCDSYFELSNKSSTHTFVKNVPGNIARQIELWRTHWDNIIDHRIDVSVNFIWYKE